MTAAQAAPHASRIAPPRPGVCDVWLVEVRPRPRWECLLSDAERERLAALGASPAAAVFLTSRGAQRLVAARYLDAAPGELAVDRSCAHCGDPRHGRPRIPGAPVDYSVSHTARWLLMAVVAANTGPAPDTRPTAKTPPAPDTGRTPQTRPSADAPPAPGAARGRDAAACDTAGSPDTAPGPRARPHPRAAASRAGLIGADIDALAPGQDADGLAAAALTPAEHAAYLKLPAHARRAAFLAAWVRKEAAMKLAALGLAAPPPRIDVSGHRAAAPGVPGWPAESPYLTSLPAPAGHAVALASAAPLAAVRRRAL
ncbi:4'-phosphopantetheinyl transferase superfamily protein [Actinacidiphila sp. DG2A-62]|uniref:4'-phosphopantetheinyl transferase family protein n=1 Tax=Actinacidiphila sp. DG2A-62 TaxID=3108821 RepID=UPI002DB63994|nr:4'-phosphopantetheinyl transferase superfamily protein [Actinacidiphila sp. DG2A-62]MEC3998150.1 4'-phosphopantetheinyl transferase superfamily protein [Actinacidiphila sp. DG2A-62]